MLSLEKALEADREKEDLGGGMIHKGQLNSEWIYEVIVFPKMPTKYYQNFWCAGFPTDCRKHMRSLDV